MILLEKDICLEKSFNKISNIFAIIYYDVDTNFGYINTYNLDGSTIQLENLVQIDKYLNICEYSD